MTEKYQHYFLVHRNFRFSEQAEISIVSIDFPKDLRIDPILFDAPTIFLKSKIIKIKEPEMLESLEEEIHKNTKISESTINKTFLRFCMHYCSVKKIGNSYIVYPTYLKEVIENKESYEDDYVKIDVKDNYIEMNNIRIENDVVKYV